MHHQRKQSPPPAPAPKRYIEAEPEVGFADRLPTTLDDHEGLEDITCECKDCGHTFTWDVGQQGFMRSLFNQGIVKIIERPSRCPSCRLKRKQFFNKNNRT